MEGDVLELENRRRIYRLISKYPGMYMREIEKELGMAVGVLEYHLNYMVKTEILSVEREGNRTRYFVREDVSYGDKATISLFRQEIPRRIVVHLMLHPGANFKVVLEQFNISKSTLSFHMKKLVEANVIDAKRDGREVSYTVRDPDATARILLTYKSSFLDKVVDRFADIWMEMHP
ncbi:MAG: winged helix-turn-helix transcriptional regulator [Candidatus Dadabacteria bacterium]|nr:winged helix-turn-helix transcriptional regulator [Candidatus Dadabacteria bacterium]